MIYAQGENRWCLKKGGGRGLNFISVFVCVSKIQCVSSPHIIRTGLLWVIKFHHASATRPASFAIPRVNSATGWVESIVHLIRATGAKTIGIAILFCVRFCWDRLIDFSIMYPAIVLLAVMDWWGLVWEKEKHNLMYTF
jgi:hypothetical protein